MSPVPPRCRVVSGQKHPSRKLRAPSSLWVGEVSRTRGSDLKCKVASSMARCWGCDPCSPYTPPTPLKCFSGLGGLRLPGEFLSSFLHPSSELSQPSLLPEALGHTVCTQPGWVGFVLHHRNAWGTALCLASLGSHLVSPPSTCPTKRDRPTPLESSGFWLAVLPAILRGVYQARSPLPAARWAGACSRQARKERPCGCRPGRPAALPTGRLWPQLLRQGGQARLSGREARAGMKRPFMAVQRPSVSMGAWPRGPVVRVSAKQTYLPKGRAARGGGAGGEPTVPRPVSQGPHFCFLGQSTESQNAVYSGPWRWGLITGPPPSPSPLNVTVADSQLALCAHGFHPPWLCSHWSLCLAFLPLSGGPLLAHSR